MSYDFDLADRIRMHLPFSPEISERKMFGGLCFMQNGHMTCGVIKSELMVRVGPNNYEHCLALPGARKMDFTGKPLRGMVYVDEDAITDDIKLLEWLHYSLDFTASLPPKK